MRRLAVAAPDAPLVSRVLAGRALGSRLGRGLLVAVAAALTNTAALLALYAVVRDGDLTAWVITALVSVSLAVVLGLYPRLAGRLPGVVADHPRDRLVEVLALLRSRRDPTAEDLLSRLVDAYRRDRRAWRRDSTTSTSGRVLVALVEGREALVVVGGEGALEDLLAVLAVAPLDSEWLPLPEYPFEVLPDLLERRGELAGAAAALRGGAPPEWALRRVAGRGLS